jgi:hypothetical protein
LNKEEGMTLERWIRLIAGLLVGLNLAQSAVTGFCPLELVLARLGVGAGGRPHPASV